MERGAKSAKAKKPRPTVTRKPRQVDASTGLHLQQRLAEALEQHAAISEIMQVISASPSDVHPALNTVAERAEAGRSRLQEQWRAVQETLEGMQPQTRTSNRRW